MPQVPNRTIDPAEARAAAKRLYYRQSFGISDFFQRELKITTKAVGQDALIPFLVNPVQAPVLQDDIKQLETRGFIRDVIAKCRQPGGSTYSSAVVWNRVSLFDGLYAFIIAQDKSTVSRIFNMHDIFRLNMSPDIRPPLKYFTKGESMVLGEPGEEETGLDSQLLVGEAKNIHLGVGRTIHCLHMSEVCRYPSSDPIKESLIPACSNSKGTVRIVESAAHFGQGADWFRYQCERSMHETKIGKEPEYHFFFLEWWKLPEYSTPLDRGEKMKFDVEERHLMKKYGLTAENIKWRRAQIEEFEGDINSFYLSYPMNYEEMWISKEISAFPQERLMELNGMIKPPIKRFRIEGGKIYEHERGELWVWVLPESNKTYDIGADVGEGYQDGDWSVAEVIERGSNIQCAEYRDHVIPTDFAEILAAIGKMYNTAQIAPEVNNQGLQTVHELAKIYTNLYIWRKDDQIAPKLTGLMGWKTMYDSKIQMVGLAHKLLYHRQVQIFSKVLLDEMRHFGRDYTDSGLLTYRAVSGHDDCVMAYCIALKVSEQENFGFNDPALLEKKPTPKLDPATHDTDWPDIMSGKSDYERIVGSWD